MEADALSQIDWEKDDKTLPADSIQAIVTAALTGQGNDYIETIPCSSQITESLTPSIHDNAQVVCKSITMSDMESNSDSSICPDPSWNLKCMTMLDWVKVQAEDQVIGNSFNCIKLRIYIRVKTTGGPEMKHFLKQRSKLLLRNGIFILQK